MKRTLIALLLLFVALAGSAELEITRRGYYVVMTPAGDTVSQHAEIDKAIASAANWSAANEGRVATITPPSYEVASGAGEGGGVDDADESVGDSTDEPVVGEGSGLPDGVLKLPASATLAQVQDALDGDRPVAVAAGSVFEGALILPDADEWLGVWGEGARPVLKVPAGRHGIEVTGDRVESAVVEGWAVRGPPALQRDIQGVRVKLNSQAGRYVRLFELRDCVVDGFDDLVYVCDDWSRIEGEKDEAGGTVPPGAPGRITFAIRDCVLINARSSDSHAVGVYAEGTAPGSVIERTVIWRSGWTADGRDPREKRSHNVYAQELGAWVAVRDCYFLEPSAAGLMLRRGGEVERVVIAGAPTPVVMFGAESSRLVDVAVVDQVDIDADAADGLRNRAVNVWDTDRFVMSGVVMARRRGVALNRPVVSVSAGEAVAEGNAVVSWPSGSASAFEVNGGVLDGRDGNRVIGEDPGVPSVTDELLGRLLNRQRGERWADQDTPAAFVRRAQEAVAEQAAVYEGPIEALAGVGGPARRVVGAAVDETAEGYVVVRQPGVTIDGGGATVRGWPVNVLADGVTIRNLRVDVGEDAIRAGGLKAVGADGLLVKDARAVTIEHVTARGATDECIEVYGSAATAVRHCLIADPIIDGLHPKGAHGLGCNVVGVKGTWSGEPVTIERNLFVRCDGRHPSVYPAGNAEDYAASSVHVRVVNNVIYHPGRFVSRLGSREPELRGKGGAVIDFAGNVIITSDKTDLDFLKKCVQVAPWETLYQRDNTIVLPDGSAHDLFEWAGVGGKPFRGEPNYPLGKGYLSDPRAIVRAVCEQAGATPGDRHAQDQDDIDAVLGAKDAWTF
jgi:hypothetical protein